MRRRLYALALGLVGALAAIGAAEAAFRRDEASVVYLWDSGRRFATRPGIGGANAESFHERDGMRARTPGVRRRVAALGDSLTWGTGPAEEAWPRLAETRLGAGWEVLNFSHYGYDIAQSNAALREHAWAYTPDVVVYAAYTNDPLRSTWIDLAGRPVWIARDGLLPSPLRRASAIARRVEGAILAPTVGDAPDWAFYRAELAAMKADADARGVPLLVLGLVPWVLADPDRGACVADPARCAAHAAIADEQARISAELGLPHLPVLPAWRAAGVDLAPPDPSDWQHPGRAGHALIAEVASGWLAAWDGGGP